MNSKIHSTRQLVLMYPVLEPIHFLAGLLVLLSMVSMGCSKESPFLASTSDAQTETNEDIVWRHHFDTLSGQDFTFVQSVPYQGNPIYLLGSDRNCQFGSAQMVTCLDADTGKKLWGFNYGDTCRITHVNGAYIYRDILVVNTNWAVLAFNLLTKTPLWEYPIECPMSGSLAFTGIYDKVYLGVSMGDIPYSEAYSLLEIDVHTGQSRSLIDAQTQEEKAFLDFNPPALWESSNSDSSFLLFSASRYTGHPDHESFALFAYDRKTGRVVWVSDSIGYPTNNFSYPTVIGDRVILAVGNGVQCFNVRDGRRLWKITMPGSEPYLSSFACLQPAAAKGRIILNTTSGPLTCLDVNTGKILWSMESHYVKSSSAVVIQDDVIYHPGGYGLLAIDLFTGQVLKQYSPRTNLDFDQLLFHPERKLLFAYDRKDVLAYRTIR